MPIVPSSIHISYPSQQFSVKLFADVYCFYAFYATGYGNYVL